MKTTVQRLADQAFYLALRNGMAVFILCNLQNIERGIRRVPDVLGF